MYRPQKRKMVRRVSVASAVAVVAAAGLGITFIVQSGATTSAVAPAKDTRTAAATTPSTTTATSATTPAYHVVGLAPHDDAGSSGDN